MGRDYKHVREDKIQSQPNPTANSSTGLSTETFYPEAKCLLYHGGDSKERM